MQITVNVADVDLDSIIEPGIEGDGETYGSSAPVTLREAVLQHVAGDVLARMTYEDKAEIRRRISEIRAEAIRELVEPMLREAIAAGVQRTNTFGEPVGEPKPLRDVIIEEARGALTKNTGYGRDSQTYVQKIVNETVRDVIASDLKAEIKAEADKARAAIRAAAAELIAIEAAKR